jgi:serine/threonine-protein kinase/endoribonuclease IRE1
VAGMVAFYILTKGAHPFGEKPNRLRNLLDDKPVGLDTLKDHAAKDLIAWMLSYYPKDRPSAEEALKHPYFQSAKQQFKMLCIVGNQLEIKVGRVKSDVVLKFNTNPKDWRNEMEPRILKYLTTGFVSRGRKIRYGPSWTECLRLIRNVHQHWHDQRPRPQPEEFYLVGNPQTFFLNLFPSRPVTVHRIIRSCEGKERPDLKEFFL